MKSLYLPPLSHLVFKCPSSHPEEAGRLTDANSGRPDMTAILRPCDPSALSDHLRNAHAMTRPLMLEIIDKACRRFPSLGQGERTARVMHLVDAEAWTDAALALMSSSCRCGRSAASPMTRANGTARFRANANCRIGSTPRSKPATQILRLRCCRLSSKSRRWPWTCRGRAFPPYVRRWTRSMSRSPATISARAAWPERPAL